MSSADRPLNRIGPYEVVGLLGTGGMGEVFRACDPRLRRDVAIKLLPASVALDEEQLARFEREARILASLDHQHIAGIYGVEEVGGTRALVLELVEGPTIAERLVRGPLDVHDALTIARQIADAVEAAHEQGIVHRDLKPANIKVRADGIVKVLDFGLARVGEPPPAAAGDANTASALATREGTVMGTPAYMSPEQARGRAVDKRTDIWAFGSLLFEMLTGGRAFDAETMTDTLVRVLHQEPDLRALPHFLDDDARVADVSQPLAQILLQTACDQRVYRGNDDRRDRHLPRRHRAGVRCRRAGRAHGPELDLRHTSTAGRDASASPGGPTGDALVAGRQAHCLLKPGGSYGDSLYVADADGQHEREVVKHEGARHVHWPRWSRDGRYVYFNSGFQNGNLEPTEIFRVAVDGGAPEAVVSTTRRAVSPLPGPDGRTLLYAGNPDGAELNLRRRDLASGRDERLTFGVGEYASPSISSDGRRLVAMATALRQVLYRVPVRFDSPAALEPVTGGYTGDLTPTWSPDGTRLAFSSSRTGQRNIWWTRPDLTRALALTSGAAFDEWPAYSPDGSQVAFVSDRDGRRGIWIVAADGGAPRFIAAAQVLNGGVSWSRDAKRLVYAAPGGDLPQVETVDVSSGRITRLPTTASANAPVWSPVEDVIAYVETLPDLGGFVRFMTADGRPLARGPADSTTRLNNGFVCWSPDGKRLAGIGNPGNRNGYVWILDPLGPIPFRKLIDLPADAIARGASWTRDGSSIVIALWQTTGDIILAERSR